MNVFNISMKYPWKAMVLRILMQLKVEDKVKFDRVRIQ